MNPRIEILPETKFIGVQIKMSMADDKTVNLWRSFMPRRHEIKNNIGTELYSMKVYDPLYFNGFDPNAEFEKWAAIEVADFDIVPNGMEGITTSGL